MFTLLLWVLLNMLDPGVLVSERLPLVVGKIVYKKVFGSHTYAMITALPHKDLRSMIAPLFASDKVRGTVYHEDNKIPIQDAHITFEKLLSNRTLGKIVLVL